MPKGRKPRPTHLKIMDGSAAKNPQRLNRSEPQVADPLGKPPKTLTKQAAAVWREEAVYWATSADRAAFGRYCQAVADAAVQREILDSEGWYATGSRGQSILNPAYKVYRDSLNHADRLAVEFGMTPSSRVRVKVPEKPKMSTAERLIAERPE